MTVDSYWLNNALAVGIDACAEVDAAHILHQYVEGCIERHLYLHTVLARHTVKLAHLLAVDVHGGKVGYTRHSHHTADRLIEVAAIEHIAVTLVHILKGKQRVAFNRLYRLEHIKQSYSVSKLYTRYRYYWQTLRNTRNIILNILLYKLSQSLILRCSPTSLAYRSVVVVACDVGLYVALVVVVGSCRKAEVGSTMHHIVVEAYAGIQILLGLLYHTLGSALYKRLIPMVEPSRIKLSNHIRTHTAMILVYGVAQILHIVLAIGCRQSAINNAALKQPRAVGCKHRDVEASLYKHISYSAAILAVHLKRYIRALLYVRSKLVLCLNHNYRTALGYLIVGHLCRKFIDIHTA